MSSQVVRCDSCGRDVILKADGSCPSCLPADFREHLAATGVSREGFSVGTAFSEGRSAFASYRLALIVMYLLTVVHVLLCSVPVVSWLYIPFVAPAIYGGICAVLLRAVRHEKPTTKDFLTGFRRYGSNLGVCWALLLLGSLAALPVFGAGVAAGRMIELDGALLLVGLGGLVSIIVSYALVLAYGYSWFVVADDRHQGSPIRALRRSAEITRGFRLKLLAMWMLAGLWGASGLLLFGIGVFVTMPEAMCAMTSAYRQLADRHNSYESNKNIVGRAFPKCAREDRARYAEVAENTGTAS